MRVRMVVNGRPQTADDVWEGESLLYVLRERLGLPGSKSACEQGECGSCTVRLDGVPVCACLVAAGQAHGREVLTVEGLAAHAARRAATTAREPAAPEPPAPPAPDGPAPATASPAPPAPPPGTDLAEARRWRARPADPVSGELAPVQRAFLDAGAVQCGFCTPGLLVAADELLERTSQPSDADIREALAGNLCRCTGYASILDAVRLAAARASEGA
ncbi:(2Fe-2S)-binding protein [Streptomyces sp. NPDC057702]|uniref:(2Fe-2S)-binding protein n=1 Tax=unclassified Streptomyces TaxID=2593676 RepID=UPI003698A0C4